MLAVVSLVHVSSEGWTATTTVALLTSMPMLMSATSLLLVVAAPDLMRVRARGPLNCPGSTTTDAEECPSWPTVSQPEDLRATLPPGVLPDAEDIRRSEGLWCFLLNDRELGLDRAEGQAFGGRESMKPASPH